MALKTSKSFDDAGEFSAPQNGAASATTPAPVVNQGGAIRDLLINFNAMVRFIGNRVTANPGLTIDTNFDVKNANAVTYVVDGVLKTLSANTSFDTGTAATITANLWGIAILTHNGTTATVTWATATAAMGYASEALAIAALGKISTLIPASGFASIGYVTVQAGASLWTAGTDALATGAGGTPAATTNYYNDPGLDGTFGAYQIGDMTGTVIVQ